MRHGVLVLQPLLALALVWLIPRIGTAQVLLVIWTAVVAMAWPPRITLAAVVVADVAVYLLLSTGGHDNPLIVTQLYVAGASVLNRIDTRPAKRRPAMSGCKYAA